MSFTLTEIFTAILSGGQQEGGRSEGQQQGVFLAVLPRHTPLGALVVLLYNQNDGGRDCY